MAAAAPDGSTRGDDVPGPGLARGLTGHWTDMCARLWQWSHARDGPVAAMSNMSSFVPDISFLDISARRVIITDSHSSDVKLETAER